MNCGICIKLAGNDSHSASHDFLRLFTQTGFDPEKVNLKGIIESTGMFKLSEARSLEHSGYDKCYTVEVDLNIEASFAQDEPSS
jgi:hypothetical protein